MGFQPHPYAVLYTQRLIGSYRRWCCLKAFFPVSAGRYNRCPLVQHLSMVVKKMFGRLDQVLHCFALRNM